MLFRALVILLALQAPPVLSQTKVLTLNQERLFSLSSFGQRVRVELNRRTQTLNIENRRIETELEAEEQSLTEQRSTLTPEEFRELADAFDAKVVELRAQQTKKTQALSTWVESERTRFFSASGPLLLELIRELDGAVVLDHRSVIMSIDRVDITGRAIQRINATLGDGAPKE